MSKIDAYTKLLLHCNGADGSAVFTDETGKTVTRNGDAQIDTAQYKFGGASGLFDGAGDCLSLADSDDWDFGTGDWTVDFWVRRNGNQVDYADLVSGAGFSGGWFGWLINFGAASAGTTNKIVFSSKGSGSWANNIISSTTIADTTWTHVAVVRYGNTATMYFNGTSVGSANVTGYTLNSANNGVRICQGVPTGAAEFKGHIDEIRISKGIARWTAAFTPPTKEYVGGGLFTFHG